MTWIEYREILYTNKTTTFVQDLDENPSLIVHKNQRQDRTMPVRTNSQPYRHIYLLWMYIWKIQTNPTLMYILNFDRLSKRFQIFHEINDLSKNDRTNLIVMYILNFDNLSKRFQMYHDINVTIIIIFNKILFKWVTWQRPRAAQNICFISCSCHKN